GGTGAAREARAEAGEERCTRGRTPSARRAIRRPRRGRGRRRVRRFSGGGLPQGTAELGYEETLEALLSLVGRPVLVLFSGTAGSPFISGVVSGRLDRGELDERLQEVLLRGDGMEVETLFFHVGSRQSGFV